MLCDILRIVVVQLRHSIMVVYVVFFLRGSGPCMTLIISKGGTGEGVIPQFRDLIGPKDVNKAKEEAPERFVCRLPFTSSRSPVYKTHYLCVAHNYVIKTGFAKPLWSTSVNSQNGYILN